MKIHIETFGCTYNQADSQIMAGLIKENDGVLTESPEDADIIILNTCYVKHPTEQKVMNKITKITNRYPEKKLIISGCMVEIDQDKLIKAAPQASWIGPHKIQSTPAIVKDVLKGEVIRSTGYSNDSKICLPKVRSNPLIHIIQICEGCDGKCSYCCTRFARGSLQSYPVAMIKQEAEQAVADGCKEILITAQDTAAYGKDTGESLSVLINRVLEIDGKFRVRVGMMHPKNILDDIDGLIESFKGFNVYKFLHIPIQSGSNYVLDDMNRGHTVEEFKDIVARFRAEIPGISIATDIIVGYPTETDDAFSDTLNLIEEIKPDFLHISKYHHRPGTFSSSMDEIDPQIMKKRIQGLKSN